MAKQSIRTTILLFLCIFVINFSSFAVKPVPPASQHAVELNEETIIQNIEKARGKKLNILEKLITKSAINKSRKKKKRKSQGENKKMATAALVLGIFSFLGFIPVLGLLAFPAAILAVIFGSIALKRVKKDPENYGGRGMAIAGLVLGIVFLSIFLLLVIFLLILFAAFL